MAAPLVIVADGHELSAAGLTYLAAKALENARIEVAKDRKALHDVLEYATEGVLIINPYGVNGMTPDNLAGLLESYPGFYPLLVVPKVEQNDLRHLVKQSAIAIVTKNCSQREMLVALEAALHREKFVCNKVMEAFLETGAPAHELSAATRLSDREISVIRLIADGLSTDEIGDKLHLSPHTVHAHRKNILKKLNVKTPVELVVKAFRERILTV